MRGRRFYPFFIAVLILVFSVGAADQKQSASRSSGEKDFVFVAKDAGAGGYEAFPDVCRLNDGRLMAVFYAGYGHVSLPNGPWPKGGRICFCLSSDEGRTWTKPRLLYDGPDDDRDPSIVQLQSGRLLCNFFSLRKAEGKPWQGLGTWLTASDDLGRTWAAPRLVSADYYCSSPVRELPHGRLLLGLYREEKGKSWGAAVLSEDGGKSWGRVIDIDNGGYKLDAETDVISRKDGSLYAIQREPGTTMCYSVSKDGGRTWSVSKPIGFPGHCPYLLRTREDIIILAHRLPQTSLHYSLDECRTWSENVLVDDFIGAYPSMVNLKDGSVLIVYYEEGEGSNIRAKRFRATLSGIEWLSLEDSQRIERKDQQGDWGEPDVRVGLEQGHWLISGRKNRVVLDPTDLRMSVKAGSAAWPMLPSFPGDLVVGSAGKVYKLRLADAMTKRISPIKTGFLTGLEIELQDFRGEDGPLDLAIQLFVGLTGAEEDMACEIIATDGAARVRECLWPQAFDSGAFDATVVPFMQGMLLPKNWPKKVWLYDTLAYGRGLYMPWWGHQQGQSAVLVLLETPADGGCRFEHPAGGPTRMEVRWVPSLGRWAYPRRVRFCFMEKSNYVELAKRYRRYVIETGRFVSLKEKISRNPLVAKLIGAPVVHTSILYHIQPGSSYYDKSNPAKNHQMVTFDKRVSELGELSKKGIQRAYVHLDGWGFRGYDNLHPDILPPCPEAGGWEGMKRLGRACRDLGFIFAIHDQYRDYYLDAKSYNPRFAVLDENGNRSFHSTWYGGAQTFLCPSLALGHVQKNHKAILDHGVEMWGAYLDVFAVVPPDECYNPEHPVTRAECLEDRGDCLDFVRSWGGIVSSEEPADWAVPHIDLVHHGPYALDPNPGQGPAMGIPVPLFNLVYHDALILPWSLGRGAWGIPEKDLGFLHGMANAGIPYLSLSPSEEELTQVRTLCALHERIGLVELVNHKFLEENYRRQEFSYADGTKVVIDLDKDQVDVSPRLDVRRDIR